MRVLEDRERPALRSRVLGAVSRHLPNGRRDDRSSSNPEVLESADNALAFGRIRLRAAVPIAPDRHDRNAAGPIVSSPRPG